MPGMQVAVEVTDTRCLVGVARGVGCELWEPEMSQEKFALAILSISRISMLSVMSNTG